MDKPFNGNESVNKKNVKINFKEKKENTINSLFEVEHFLCNFKKSYFLQFGEPGIHDLLAHLVKDHRHLAVPRPRFNPKDRTLSVA